MMGKNSFDVAKIALDRNDSYVRHYYMLLVSWFTFFITINWVTLGWVAKGLSEEGDQFGKYGSIVGNVFTLHCVLGIIVCGASSVYFMWVAKRIGRAETKLFDVGEVAYIDAPTFPVVMYAGTSGLMIIAIAPFVWIWRTVF